MTRHMNSIESSSSSEDEAIAALLVIKLLQRRIMKRKNRNQKLWVKPWIAGCLEYELKFPMNMKRKHEEHFRKQKKLCSSVAMDEPDKQFPEDNIVLAAVGSDTKSSLLYIRSLFPVQLFEHRLPPIILQHQLYSILKNRTSTDKELNNLREAGEIRLFKLGSEENSMCVVFVDDYKSHVLQFTKDLDVDHHLIDRFLTQVVTPYPDVSFNKQTMVSRNITDSDITQLVKACVLTVRDVGSWWLAIPAAGIFTKTLKVGRRALLAMMRRCKYNEILRSELESRKLPKAAKLGMFYHVLDLIGADQLESVPTTSGPLLRLRQNS